MPSPSPVLPPFAVGRRLTDSDARAIRELIGVVTAQRGIKPIDEARLETSLRPDGERGLTALAWDASHRHLVGYAQALRGTSGWQMEVITRPGEPLTDTAPVFPPGEVQLAGALLRALRAGLAAEHDATHELWVFGADESSDRVATSAGLRLTREIHQMRRPLPVEANLQLPRSFPTRPFVMGQDDAAWLEVNNAAFAWHPDQGDWTQTQLNRAEQEDWFDPAGFLLHEIDGRLAGFCWTKIHSETDPPLGEIYVIGVDPARHGQGLGRALVLAGLAHLAEAGLGTAMLYVEAGNTPARRLYHQLGFTTHHVDRVYVSR